jgi:hypothetical protein
LARYTGNHCCLAVHVSPLAPPFFNRRVRLRVKRTWLWDVGVLQREWIE